MFWKTHQVMCRYFIDQLMRSNDEMMSAQIQKALAKRGVAVSSSAVRRSRKQQGWMLQRNAYCQMICEANKVKRLEYAQHITESGDTFHNIIFSDKCSICNTVEHICGTPSHKDLYLQRKNINWWHILPESPDFNPIEDL